MRTDQVQLLQQQVNTELVISLLVSMVVSIVLWKLATPALLIGWTTAVILSVGSRSLFISGKQSEKLHDGFNAWSKKYVFAIMLSLCSWGSPGIYTACKD